MCEARQKMRWVDPYLKNKLDSACGWEMVGRAGLGNTLATLQAALEEKEAEVQQLKQENEVEKNQRLVAEEKVQTLQENQKYLRMQETSQESINLNE